jgi:hypothetical protein
MTGNMHTYQIEEDTRTRKMLLLVFFSVIAAYLLNILLQNAPIVIPWWIDYPSVLGFYGLFGWLYDRYVWKMEFVQKSEWLLVPNLNGVWNVELKTCYDDFTDMVKCRMFIRQTGSKIRISIETDNSISHSVQASILCSAKLKTFEIMYTYINQPKAASKSTMNIHYGTASLQISDDFRILEGDYYSGRGRQTYGSLIAKRQGNKKNSNTQSRTPGKKLRSTN